MSANPLTYFKIRRRKPLLHRQRWGDWWLDAKRLCLVLRRNVYEVDLETIDSSAELLDWIFQVRKWATPEELVDLLTAFHDILHPQANLCAGGKEKRLNSTAQLRRQLPGGQL